MQLTEALTYIYVGIADRDIYIGVHIPTIYLLCPIVHNA